VVGHIAVRSYPIPEISRITARQQALGSATLGAGGAVAAQEGFRVSKRPGGARRHRSAGEFRQRPATHALAYCLLTT
jgi:hypothetical protein